MVILWMIKDTDTAILFRKYVVGNGNIEKKNHPWAKNLKPHLRKNASLCLVVMHICLSLLYICIYKDVYILPYHQSYSASPH